MMKSLKAILLIALTTTLIGFSGMASTCEAGRWGRNYRRAHRQFHRDLNRSHRDFHRSYRRYDRYYDRRFRTYPSPYRYGRSYYPYGGYGGGVSLPSFSIRW